MIVVGLIGGEITLSTPLIPRRALTLQGSYVGNLKDLSDLMALVATGKVPPIPTQVRPLEDANAALDALRAGKVVGRVVLKP